jgi:hypothetical protein
VSDNPSRADEPTKDPDFSGLLPGDDQPRRSRRPRHGRTAPTTDAPTTEAPTPEVTVAEETSATDAAVEETEVSPRPPAGGNEGEVPREEGGGEGDSIAPESAADTAADTAASEEPDQSPHQTSLSSDPSPSTRAGEVAGPADPRITEPANEPTTTPASTRSSNSAAPGAAGELTGSGLAHDAPDVREAAADSGGRTDEGGASRGIAPASGASATTPVTTTGLGDGLSKALDEQAVILDGHELDSRLRQVAQMSPQERSRYKTTLLFSEEHYDLLCDLCRNFRKRGFKAHEASMSNIVSVGLEAAREALEADQGPPT